MNPVLAELNERGDRVIIHFRYDGETKDRVKSVPGAKFVPRDKGGPFWQLPLDITSMRILRQQLGSNLALGDALKAWGREAVKAERQLRSLSLSDDHPADEMRLSEVLPGLLYGGKKYKGPGQWPGLRPYQRADVAFLSKVTGALNLNEQRLGKTPEVIGTIYEAGLENGQHLIVGLQKSLESVWRFEFERFTDLLVFTFSGASSSTERAKMFALLERCVDDGRPFVFCTTAAMIRRGLPDGLEMHVPWTTVTIDEYHKTGLPEPKNAFSKKIQNVKSERRVVMSGTPMGGKEIKLFGALQYISPDRFTSKWRWAGQWLDVTEDHGHKQIGRIKKGREQEFYEALSSYVVRRTRAECLPQLPPKQHVEVWCSMSKAQNSQYATFARDAEIRIDEHHLSATSVLAEYTRLKQFSNARCEVEILGRDIEAGTVDMKVVPTFDSGKLPDLYERLIEQGIDPEDPGGKSQALISTQFLEHAKMISRWLDSKGIKNAILSGKTNKKESERIQKAFKHGNDNEGLRVCVIVTTMGVGITLDNIETVHMFDETWVPDDEDQVTDRAINTTRNHQVTVFHYRSKGTVEEHIYNVTSEKAEINAKVLDKLRVQMKEGVE